MTVTMAGGALMVGDDRAAIRGALLTLRRDTGLPVAFGGLVTDGARDRGRPRSYRPPPATRGRLRILEVLGTRTMALPGLTVRSGCGLGGKVLALGRPFAVSDYQNASLITHDYDAAVAAEDLHSVIAVPVVVRRAVRAVLYSGTRRGVNLGDRAMDAAVETARMLEQDLVVQDEINERLELIEHPAGGEPGGAVAVRPSAAEWEEVRLAYTELRLLARRVDDPRLRGELLQVCDRLSGSAAVPGADAVVTRAIPPRIRLTPRELDVLSCVAAGCGNAETARRLGLRPETVKGYLREVMRKLGVHSRFEAVIAARRAGLLP